LFFILSPLTYFARRRVIVSINKQSRQRAIMYTTVKQYFLRPADYDILGSKLRNLSGHAHAHGADRELVTESDLVALQNSGGNEVNAACTARRKIASLAVEDPQVFRSLQQELRSRRIFTHSAVASVLSDVLARTGEELMTKTATVREVNFSRNKILIEVPALASAPKVNISSVGGIGVSSAGLLGRSKTSDPLQLSVISGTSASRPQRSLRTSALARRASSCFFWKQQEEQEPSNTQDNDALVWKRRQKMRKAQQPSLRTIQALNMAWKYIEEDSQSSFPTADIQSRPSESYEETPEQKETNQEAKVTYCSKIISTVASAMESSMALGSSFTYEENPSEDDDATLLVEFPLRVSSRHSKNELRVLLHI
jgi:hypothetical protein